MALCAMVIGICSTAQAQSSSTVSFSLTAPVALNTGIDSIDAGRATVGSWIDSYRPNQSHWQNAYSTSIYLSGGISYLGGPGPGHIADPANESYHYTRPTGDGFNSEFLGVKPGGDFGIMESTSYNAEGNHVFEGVSATAKTISATATVHPGPSYFQQAYAEGHWSRDFELNPHSSFTLSGQLSWNGAGTDGSGFGNSGRTLNHGWAGQYNNLFDLHGSIGDGGRVDYSSDANGLMSATFYNLGDVTLSGNVGIDIAATSNLNPQFAKVSAVPEPSMYLSMLVGLGVVGGLARKRRAKGAVSAT